MTELLAIKSILVVALGGAIGASLRHMSGIMAIRMLGLSFPYGTLFVNIFGSLLMGIFIAWLAKRAGGSSNELRLFFATGVLGGFTTFSAFSLDVANMLERGQIANALGYITASVVFSIAAILIGLWIGRSLL